ncbi:MAG: hypothetical protein HY721_04370 [Planctomycetes bacterium]|nr:hypothetical protein [Planctomycetota bacterium]
MRSITLLAAALGSMWASGVAAEAQGSRAERPESALRALVEAEWEREDGIDGTPGKYLEAAARALERARGILERRRGAAAGPGAEGPLVAHAAELERLAGRLASLAEASGPRADAGADPASAAWRELWLDARWLRRAIELADPLLSFGKLLFAKAAPPSYSHLVMQHFGWRARPGGGLFVLERPGRSLGARDLLQGALASGSVLAPCLSWDATRVVFSFSRCSSEDPFFHLFEARLDGTGLRQLTSGELEDLMPAYLPGGDVVFSSTRRKGYARCFGPQFGERWNVYTLHRLDPESREIRTLSFHETNEWFPAVLPDGSVLYSRWDYVDRHAVLHQNLWVMRPDGTSPAALWGNHTQSPHCSFQARPVPGSRKIAFTASAHHSITGGSIALVDPALSPDGEAAVTRVTPEVCFPEAEGGPREWYAAPWPLSEDVFLVAYSARPLVFEPAPNDPAALGIYLLDRRGGRELLYRDPAIGSTDPIPLAPRPAPPAVAAALALPLAAAGAPAADGAPAAPGEVAAAGSAAVPAGGGGAAGGAADRGEMLLLDAYRGLEGVPRGAVKALRILQVLPKSTPVADVPRVGLAGQEPAKAVLGTVPVEEDGSAFFAVPARKPLSFQALDDRGMALQTMRSVTYVQPGERVACAGCHDDPRSAPPAREPIAARRPPSEIRPGPDGCAPFSYPRLVQPVLDRRCVSCHGDEAPAGGLALTGTPHDGFSRSYWALCAGPTFYGAGTTRENAARALVPRFGGWNPVHRTEPGGAYGARGSRLVRLLLEGHAEVKLEGEELERLATWIDANALFYGTYDPAEQARQLRGEAVGLPELQ